jgi:hypothetical protein
MADLRWILQLEDPEELKQRISSAAKIIAGGTEKRSIEEAMNQYVFCRIFIRFCLMPCCIGIIRLCISPQCGFASHSEGNPVGEEDVKRKLSLVVQTAKAVWPTDA